MNDSRVGIVLVNFNSRAKTLECISSLLKSSYREVTLIVIENGSSDGTRAVNEDDLPDAIPSILVKNEHNLGFAGGMNSGIRECISLGCKYCFVLNNDTHVAETCLELLVNAFADCHGRAGCVSPMILDLKFRDRIQFAGGTARPLTQSSRFLRRNQDPVANSPYETERCTGAAMLLSASALQAVGLFDERLFFQCEDTDLCMRLKKAGFRLIVHPRAKVWHEIGGTLGERMSPVSVFFATRNFFTVMEKNLRPIRRCVAFFAFGFFWIPYSIAVYVVSRRTHLIRPFILGILWHIGWFNDMTDDKMVQYFSEV